MKYNHSKYSRSSGGLSSSSRCRIGGGGGDESVCRNSLSASLLC